jgi:hypothetical protein
VSDADINHFLVVYNLAEGRAHVERFGTDYAEALAAYAKAEEDFANRDTFDIVLLGADSIETIERTHSSYFHTEETFESLLPPGMLVK